MGGNLAEERIQRRLAAILAADVVGYSRLMGVDEAGTLAAVTSHISEVFHPEITTHNGRIFKTMGDAVFAEFASVVDAVQCAIAVQAAILKRNSGIPENRRIEFRIGVNLGDVIVQDDDVFGDGVNVATRLESIAKAGCVCVSGSVHEQVVKKIEVEFDDLGPQQVKNIGEPVRAFRIRPDVSTATEPVPSGAPPLPDKPSIAVLPFENMSNDPEQEYFSDGITEDIITELSKISGLFVIARHSAFTYKGKSVTLKQVGRELGVRYVMEGSVRKAGNRLRITGQLIDSETDHHIWAERYDRDLADIFAVQDEVARQVAEALTVALAPGEGEQLAHKPTNNLEAYDLYIRSRMSAWPPTQGNIVASRDAYNRVIEIDNEFAGGYAGASITYSLAVRFGHSEEPEKDVATALELAKHAMALDDKFALSHSALGYALSASGNYEESIAAARHAVELQPGDSDGYMYLSNCLSVAGRGEEAREAVLTALRLDPQYVRGPYYNALGRACFIAGRYEEAVEAYDRNKKGGGPIAVPMLSAWTACLGILGHAKAREKADELLSYAPNYTISQAHKTWQFGNPDDLNRFVDGLRKAGVPE
jgi:adenylate cyclase